MTHLRHHLSTADRLGAADVQTVVSMVLPKGRSLLSGAQASKPQAPSAVGGILAAQGLPPLRVLLQDVTADCDALLAALRSGDSVETTDGSGAEVSLVFSPLGGSSVGRAPDGAFVLFTPRPQVTTRRMTIITPGLSCCCGSSGDEAHQPRAFWVLPGHGLTVRSVSVPFALERVELRCDPSAPQ